ncbi:MAG: nitrilase-related carbon-nitrogen hydrolase [Deltaproteobacteria bacterium]|nr:nitrilase-related carbon-nitrogen hydrolase [Deltaproteobacteria bacterium]
MNRDRVLKVAGIQLAATEDRDKNLAKAGMLIELAAVQDAKIIALSQLFGLRWFPRAIDKANFSLAEREDGPSVTMLRERAARHSVALVAPVFEEDDGAYYNTAFVIGPDGGIIGKYRKMHVPQLPLWEEKAYFSPGNLGFPVFETPFARIGVQLCWDVFFPEGFRILALKGAEVVFAPTASAFDHSHRKWERAVCASAHANGVFIMRVNRVGKEEKQLFYGRSFCARPDGEFVEKPSGPSEGVVLADIDLGDVSSTRNEWVFLKDRRPSEYKEILE